MIVRPSMTDFPSPLGRADDPEDVSWALSTAESVWSRGDRSEAIKWIRRAAEAASEAEFDERAVELARLAADLASDPSAGESITSIRTASSYPEQRSASQPPPPPPSRPPPPLPTAAPALVSFGQPKIGASPPRPMGPPRPVAQADTGARPPAAPPKMPAAAPRAPQAVKVPSSHPQPLRGGDRGPLVSNILSSAKPLGKPVVVSQSADATRAMEALTTPPADPGTPKPAPVIVVPHAPTTSPDLGRSPELLGATVPPTRLRDDNETQERWALSDFAGEENKTRLATRAYESSDKMEAAKPVLPEVAVQSRPSQAVRVVVWRNAEGVHVAPYGTHVSAISFDAMLVAMDPSADFASWLLSGG